MRIITPDSWIQGVKVTDDARSSPQEAIFGRVDKIFRSKKVYQLLFTQDFYKPG